MSAFEEKRMKIQLELHIVGDGRRFLNFWNYINGKDVIVEIKDGKLFRENKEKSLQEFIEQVIKRANED